MNEPMNQANIQPKMGRIRSIACTFIVKDYTFQALLMLSKNKMEYLFRSSINMAGRANGLMITFNSAPRLSVWRSDCLISQLFLMATFSTLARANAYRS